ncbi:MAG: peptidylprolyl isomerase [Desulfatiglandaceae bacterium]
MYARFTPIRINSLRVIFFLSLFLVPALPWHPAGAEIRNRVVAIVNDDVVTLHELNERLQQLTGIPPDEFRQQSEDQYLDARRRVLDMLINEKIAHEKVKELDIKVSEKDVDAAIERIKSENQLTHADLLAQLKADGTGYDAYRKEVKRELERMQLINQEVKSKIFLREEELKDYYEKHIDEFRSTANVRLAIILLKQQDPTNQGEADALQKQAKSLLSQLDNGVPFADLARKFSDGPGAQDGGDLGKFEMSELNSQMARIVKDLSAGEVSEPVAVPGGVQIIKVVEKHKGGVKPFEQVKDAIHSTIYKQELDKKYSAWLERLREDAYTKIIF